LTVNWFWRILLEQSTTFETAVQELLKRFFASDAYAVVGVSDNREKYGNIVFRYLRDKNFPVYPVNPKLSTVEGVQCYASVTELPDSVKSVVLVVPPQKSLGVVQACAHKNICAVWMQPGAESMNAIDYASTCGIGVIYDACIMVMLAGVKDFNGLSPWLKNLGAAYHP
jgi:uncharacterized protein